MSKQTRWKNYKKEDLTTAIANSFCWSDVCRALAVSVCTYNFKRLQGLCGTYKLTTNHFDIKATFKRNKRYWTHEELFTANSRVHKSVLRDYIRRHDILELKCVECSIGKEWNSKPIVLEIDHINGHSDDNRIENLRMLCPNCHSQTVTYRRRN